MIPAAKLKEYMELNIIQIAPLAFMRGRTLNDAVVILDEAQNTTHPANQDVPHPHGNEHQDDCHGRHDAD